MTCRSAVLAAALLAGLATPALAQMQPGQMQLKTDAAKRGRAPAEPAPAALPGAVSAPARNTGKSTAGMKPNEALFDAVNRGDIASAREALGRGADVDARNVLGLTPVELSVDLGRNDITFLLLSMRGSGSGRGSAPPPPVARAAAPPVRMATAAPAPRPAPTRPVATVSAPAPGNAPVIPAPQAGFLGFGGSH